MSGEGVKAARGRSRRPWRVFFGWALILLLVSCGERAGEAPGDELDLTADVITWQEATAHFPVPDPGPRWFAAPTQRYFNSDTIRAVPEDPAEREPLILKDNVYWLSDAHAATMKSRALKVISFPLEGNHALLGHRPGHLVINKYYGVRHIIEDIYIGGGEIRWSTRMAEMGEVVASGHLYVDIKPEHGGWPVGFDPVDVYLYRDRQEQLEVIEARYLDSPLIQNQLTQDWADKADVQALLERRLRRQRADDVDTIVRRQGLDCTFPASDNDVDDPLFKCASYVTANIGEYRASGAGAPGPQSLHQSCIDNGNTREHCETQFDMDGNPMEVCRPICICSHGMTEDECMERVCTGADYCDFEEPDEDAEQTVEPSAGGSIAICVNPDTNPAPGHTEEDRCRADLAIKVTKEFAISAPSADAPLVTLAVRPIFMLTLGFKASLKFYFLGAKLRFGFYAGVGYGVNAGLEIAGIGKTATFEKTWYWTRDFNKTAFQIPIFFIALYIDPVIRVRGYAEAALAGAPEYEYFNEKWFYACFYAEAGTRGFRAGIEIPGVGSSPPPIDEDGNRPDTLTRCGFENRTRADAEFNGFVDNGDPLNVEIIAGLVAGVGAELRVGLSGGVDPGAGRGVRIYPIEARANINLKLRAPRCSYHWLLNFGGSYDGQVTLGKVAGKTLRINLGRADWTYGFLPRLYGEVPLTGGIWESIFKCGVFPKSEPYTEEVLDCPLSPNPRDKDGNCAADMGSDARCFVDECVVQKGIRVSMAYSLPASLADEGLDVNLLVRDPGGTTHTPGDTSFTRTSCGGACGEESSRRFIENFTIDGPRGRYEIWVEPNAADPLTEPVPFTVEVETLGDYPTRQTLQGTLLPNGEASPASFIVCKDEEGCDAI